VAEAEYSTTAKLPVETIWEYVREMDNWAPFLRGYRGHEKQSEADSVWTLKGDVGVLARTLKFRVHVTEWAGPERVCFELEGLNEPMKGGGSFRLERFEGEAGGGAAAPVAAAPKSWLLRTLEAGVRLLLRLFGGGARRAATADAGPGEGMARLTFRLRLEPGGPMAPMIDAMIRPVMLPTAEELANKIMGHLEDRHREAQRGARSGQ
jgi:carbon monoxide dehydrogenase subunit G